MFLPPWFLIALAASSVLDSAVPIEEGDYVVVYARIDGCLGFPGILGFGRASADAKLSLLTLEPIEMLNKTPSQIYEEVSGQIANRRRDRKAPASLRIEVLRSEQEYLAIERRLLTSLEYLASGDCIPARWPPLKSPPYEDQRFRLMWKSIAGTPNNSLQRTHQSVTLFASQKLRPFVVPLSSGR